MYLLLQLGCVLYAGGAAKRLFGGFGLAVFVEQQGTGDRHPDSCYDNHIDPGIEAGYVVLLKQLQLWHGP